MSMTWSAAVAQPSPPARTLLAAKPMPQSLTLREQEVMLLVSEGLSNKQVARRLDLTEGTVKIHLHNIYHKTGVVNRTALTAWRSRTEVRN
jgi:DNA-binding CsgD family transcriptional regulator